MGHYGTADKGLTNRWSRDSVESNRRPPEPLRAKVTRNGDTARPQLGCFPGVPGKRPRRPPAWALGAFGGSALLGRRIVADVGAGLRPQLGARGQAASETAWRASGAFGGSALSGQDRLPVAGAGTPRPRLVPAGTLGGGLGGCLQSVLGALAAALSGRRIVAGRERIFAVARKGLARERLGPSEVCRLGSAAGRDRSLDYSCGPIEDESAPRD